MISRSFRPSARTRSRAGGVTEAKAVRAQARPLCGGVRLRARACP